MKIFEIFVKILFSALKILHKFCLAFVLGWALGFGNEIRKVNYIKSAAIESKK